jgi:catechol 2,3-dioxygenase-like lactoylglutathione lyase family enzyme
MINGAHVVIYSTDAEADRAFLRDVLGFRHVDVGHGWLIFALPDSEVAVHPGEDNNRHEFFLMCDDVDAEISALAAKGVTCDPVTAEPWGRLTMIGLPGGGKLGLYQPRHERP